MPEQERRDFFVFLDEFQTFTTRAVAGMLAELRKYRVGLVLAHQHLAQLEPEIRAAVLGNVGTLVCFRVGPEDGEILAPYIGPDITPHDLVSTEHVCVRMLNGGVLSTAFQAARHDRKA